MSVSRQLLTPKAVEKENKNMKLRGPTTYQMNPVGNTVGQQQLEQAGKTRCLPV